MKESNESNSGNAVFEQSETIGRNKQQNKKKTKLLVSVRPSGPPAADRSEFLYEMRSRWKMRTTLAFARICSHFSRICSHLLAFGYSCIMKTCLYDKAFARNLKTFDAAAKAHMKVRKSMKMYESNVKLCEHRYRSLGYQQKVLCVRMEAPM